MVVEQHIEYKRELRAGDLVTIRSSILEAREKSMRFVHEMTNDARRGSLEKMSKRDLRLL